MLTLALIVTALFAVTFLVRSARWRYRHGEAVEAHGRLAAQLHETQDDRRDWEETAERRRGVITVLERDLKAKAAAVTALTADLDKCQAEKAQLTLAGKDKATPREQHKKTD